MRRTVTEWRNLCCDSYYGNESAMLADLSSAEVEVARLRGLLRQARSVIYTALSNDIRERSKTRPVALATLAAIDAELKEATS